jgi:glycolate oxidase iron-sulfur subunit
VVKTAMTTTPGSAAAALTAALRAEEEKLLACVHCGFCLPACPTYTRLGDEADSPRGRLYLMRAVAEGRLDPGADAFATHIDRCLGCRACEPVCPSGVEYGRLLEQAREVIVRASGPSLSGRLLIAAFGSPLPNRLIGLAGRLARATRIPGALAAALPRRLGRVRMALAMLAASRPWRGLRAGAGQHRRAAPPPSMRRVAILEGCVQQGLFGRVNAATVRVLRENGCDVVTVPGQRCCGALHAHGGDLEGTRRLARVNIAAFERARVDRVVVNAAGCGAVIKEYAELLRDDVAFAPRARAFVATVRDLNEFLIDLDPAPPGRLPLRVTYDAPCHLHHAQRITEAPLELLRRIPGLELVALPDAEECCGGAGVYGMLHPELGGRILEDKIEAIRGTGAAAVATPNPGCMMQIGAGLIMAGLPVRVVHPVELLAESYRRAPAGRGVTADGAPPASG